MSHEEKQQQLKQVDQSLKVLDLTCFFWFCKQLRPGLNQPQVIPQSGEKNQPASNSGESFCNNVGKKEVKRSQTEKKNIVLKVL